MFVRFYVQKKHEKVLNKEIEKSIKLLNKCIKSGAKKGRHRFRHKATIPIGLYDQYRQEMKDYYEPLGFEVYVNRNGDILLGFSYDGEREG